MLLYRASCPQYKAKCAELERVDFTSELDAVAVDTMDAGGSLSLNLLSTTIPNARKISIPTKGLYGAHGFPAKNGNAAPLWQSWSSDLDISVCEPGHFVMEGNLQAVLDSFLPFFAN